MKYVYLLFFSLFLSSKILVCADYSLSQKAYSEVYEALVTGCGKDAHLNEMVSDLLKVYRRQGGAGRLSMIAEKLLGIMNGREIINRIELKFLEDRIEEVYEKAGIDRQREDADACASNMMLAQILRYIKKNVSVKSARTGASADIFAVPPASSPVRTYFRPNATILLEQWKKSDEFKQVFLAKEAFDDVFTSLMDLLLSVKPGSFRYQKDLKTLSSVKAFLKKKFITLSFDQRKQWPLLQSNRLAGLLCRPHLLVWIARKTQRISELFKTNEDLARRQAVALLILKTLATKPSFFYEHQGMNGYYSAYFQAYFIIEDAARKAELSKGQERGCKRAREEEE